MREINVKPAEEILIRDGDKEYVATFNMKAVTLFQDIVNKQGKSASDVQQMLPHILYGAINAVKDTITFEEAESIANRLSAGSGMAIINEFSDSITSGFTESQKKTLMEKLSAMQISK